MIAPWVRFRKFPWFLTFICRGKFLRLFSHQTAKVCMFQPSLRTRRCVGFWISSCPRGRFPCRCFEYPWAFRRNRMVHGWGTCRDSLMSGSSPWALSLPQSCLLLFFSCILFAVVLGQLVKLKFWAQQRELKWLRLNKWRRLFHSSRVKLLLVNMSASWCLVSMYQIWILGSRLILSNNQSTATLWVSWHMSHCWISAFHYPLNHGFIVLKDI